MEKPLVTVAIPNYNYGRYLEHCLDSVLNQTYDNIEVYLRDNASTDDSYDIAYGYKKKFAERGIYFHISDNKRNVGSDMNSKLATRDAEGEFIYTLASDDAIMPNFLENCIRVFENYPNVGTVIVHRDEIDENNIIHKSAPFYNQDCVIPGEEQAAVYMMAGIAIPGQRLVRKTTLSKINFFRRGWNVAGDWYDNFLYAMAGDVAYLQEPLIQYRVHTGNETNESERNLSGIFEHYQLIHAFVDISKAFGMSKPASRYHEAVEKLGSMCLRYALKMLQNGLNDIAHRYLLLAPVLKKDIIKEDAYQKLMQCIDLQGSLLESALSNFVNEYFLSRTCSYDPPDGSIPLKL